MSRRAKGAELAAIEAVYNRDLAKLQRLATAIVGSREAGCDAVQDAFARAVHRRAEFRGDGRLEGWLWRIVVSSAREAAARVSAARPAGADYPDAAALPADASDRSELRDLIASLPERQRLAIYLRYYADLDYRAIADALGISPGTVGAALNQARQNLRHLLMEVSR
jgi:RNA polymerase sigma-70 factor (ECF subfamily)